MKKLLLLAGMSLLPLAWQSPQPMPGNAIYVDSAICDGKTDATSQIQNAINGNGDWSAVQLPTGKTCMVHGLTMRMDRRLEMNNSRLMLNQAGGTILTLPQTGGSGPGDDIRPAIENGSLDCNSLPGETVGALISNSALYMSRVTFSHCDTGYKLLIGQYGEYHSVYAISNNVGMKVYADRAAGGGVDNSWYDCFWYSNKVGIIAWGNSPYPQSDNNFYKARFSDNSVAAVASFGNRLLYEGDYGALTFYGGYGEHNAWGNPGNLTIDGLTIKPATFYLNNTRVYAHGFGGDSTSPYIYRLENYSQAVLENIGASGNPAGYYVGADSTSGVFLSGDGGGNGVFQNVAQWPNALSGQTRMFGAPIFAVDPTVPNSYGLNPIQIPFLAIRAPAVAGTVTDHQFGTISQAAFGASSGDGGNNVVYLGSFPATATTVKSDYLYSLLLKADRDCTLLVGIDSRPAGLTYLAINVTLEANRWVRVVLAAQNIPPGIQNRLNIWPLDNSGPTVAFTGLEMVALPSGPISTTATIGHILRTGAVGSNGFAKY